jgi:hypothetical protein
MFSNIPLSRLLLYILALGLIPFLFAVFYLSSRLNDISGMESMIANLGDKAYMREKKQALNIAVKNNYRDADHFYIDKQLETLSFLENEIESLQKVSSNKNFPDDENIKKRLEFLTNNNNMVFTEGVVQSNPFFQETTETLVHPVEVNVKDIRAILAKIEGVNVGQESSGPSRPQMIILDFKLEKKHMTDKNEIFNLNLKLLKREFL